MVGSAVDAVEQMDRLKSEPIVIWRKVCISPKDERIPVDEILYQYYLAELSSLQIFKMPNFIPADGLSDFGSLRRVITPALATIRFVVV